RRRRRVARPGMGLRHARTVSRHGARRASRGTAQRTRASGPVTAPRPAIEPLGECAVLVRFGTAIDPAVNARVHAAARAIAAARLAGVADIVPAYASLAVHYDPRAWQGAATQALPWRRLAARLADLVRAH